MPEKKKWWKTSTKMHLLCVFYVNQFCSNFPFIQLNFKNFKSVQSILSNFRNICKSTYVLKNYKNVLRLL